MAASDSRGKRKAAGPRSALSLLDLEHYESVLHSASRANADCIANVGSPSATDEERVDESIQVVAPLQQQQQAPRRPAKSPRASPRARIRPLPPVGIAAREDVDIYRYSQAAEQRMAIRPLFERRREAGGAGVVGEVVSTEGDDDRDGLPAARDEEPLGADFDSSLHGDTSGNGDQGPEEDVSDIETGTDADEIVDEGVADGHHEEINEDTQPIRFVPAKSLSLANCHEPFLKSESPLMLKVRAAIPHVTEEKKTTGIDQSAASSSKSTASPLMKEVWSGPRIFDDRQVAVSVMITSDGEVFITCTDQLDDTRTTTITMTDGDLMMKKKRRANLTEPTPNWISWLVSRLTLRGDGSIHLDLAEKNSSSGVESELVFSKTVPFSNETTSQSNEDRHVVVKVFLVRELQAVAIQIEDVQTKQVNELHLTSIELQTIATSTTSNDLPPTKADIDGLLHDSAFLERLCESDAVRLAVAMLSIPTLDPVDDVHSLKPGFSTASSVQATPQAIGAIGAEAYMFDDIQVQEELQSLIRSSDTLTSVALVAQAHSHSAALAATRTLSKQEAVVKYANHYITQAQAAEASDTSISGRVQRLVAAAKADKLNRLAISSILDDLLLDQLRTECQTVFLDTRRSSEFSNHFATKLQATFRMSRQRRAFAAKQRERQLAARAIQARQRGITSRNRFRRLLADCDRLQHYKLARRMTERDREPVMVAEYDLLRRLAMMQEETERDRHRTLMEVLAGYVLDATTANSPSDDRGIPERIVLTVFETFGPALAGCPSGLGDAVVDTLSDVVGVNEDAAVSACFSTNQVSAALLLALRTSHKEASPWIEGPQPIQEEQQQESSALQFSLKFITKAEKPRWVLKANAAARRENCEQQAKRREEVHRVSQQAAVYAARSHHSMLDTRLTGFEQSRRVWEEVTRGHDREEMALKDAECVGQLAHECLDRMVASIKEWGVDADLLLDALNVCYASSNGRQAVAIAHDQFDRLAAALNSTSGRVSILSLRGEIAQELGEFDKLLAMRCLSLAQGHSPHLLPTEAAMLHTVLHGHLSAAQVRRALPAVLQTASVRDKLELARRMVSGYGGVAFGQALNLICWSCVDTLERGVSPQAAQLLDLLTRLDTDKDVELEPSKAQASRSGRETSLASRALMLLTGAPFVRLLQFLAWSAHADAELQTRVRLLLSPLAAGHELVRVASAMSALELPEDARTLLIQRFMRPAMENCDGFWVQYQTLFGLEARSRAAPSASTRSEQGGCQR